MAQKRKYKYGYQMDGTYAYYHWVESLLAFMFSLVFSLWDCRPTHSIDGPGCGHWLSSHSQFVSTLSLWMAVTGSASYTFPLGAQAGCLVWSQSSKAIYSSQVTMSRFVKASLEGTSSCSLVGVSLGAHCLDSPCLHGCHTIWKTFE